MKKKELLSPVGNMESLKEAVQNGADAVYLGGKKFGARAFADNFTDEEMISAIKYCHLYGVKIYVTVNTIIYEREIESCINYIRFLHQNNVDALIMQDLGLIKIVREKFPNLEIHASTQMHNHNEEQLKLLEELGIKRVVLARELSLQQINNFNTNLELEAFIHGALCVCYSGQCLFSSLLLERSGNRGSCAGICRLPFSLIKDDKRINTNGNFLLSPKELNTIDHFAEIMQSNITSLKIEGRMKSPAYVGFITHLYRKLIDKYENNEPLTISEQEAEELKTLFNRGFTNGYLFKATNQELMNIKTSNHQGIKLGNILEITKDKIKIKLDTNLNQEDGIRFKEEDKGLIVNFLYNDKGMLINEAKKGDIVFVDNKIGLKNGKTVLKTIDIKLMKRLEKYENKKFNINCEVEAFINKPLKVTFSDGEYNCTYEGNIIEKSLKNETTENVIKEKIGSLGNTPFIIKKFKIKKDNMIFIPMSELKEIRRKLSEELIHKREEKIPNAYQEINIEENMNYDLKETKEIHICALVRNEEQLITCLEEKVDTIYVDDEELYNKYKEKENIYLRPRRVKTNFKEYQNERLLIGETGSLYKYGKNNKVRSDYFLNVVNSSCLNQIASHGAESVTLSIENKIEDIKDIIIHVPNSENIEVYLYGRPEVMITKYCPLNLLVNKDKICKVCMNNNHYYLEDRNKKLYPIISDIKENHLTHIFHYKEINNIESLKEYQKMGIRNYRIEFLEENANQVKSILCKIKQCQI